MSVIELDRLSPARVWWERALGLVWLRRHHSSGTSLIDELVHILKATLRHVGVRRHHLAVPRIRMERALIPLVRPRPHRTTGRILCYHGVGTSAWGVNDIAPDRFRRQLELALQLGYRFVPAAQIARDGGSPGQLAVTFDDGLACVLRNAAPILASLGIPWTMFVVCNWAEGRHSWAEGTFLTWEEIGRAVEMGAEIGSHSLSHPDFGKLESETAAIELARSREVIRERTGINARSFAIPFGQSRNWRPELTLAAQAAGYEVIYAQAEGSRVPGTVPRTFITGVDGNRTFRAALTGAFDGWEEWF